MSSPTQRSLKMMRDAGMIAEVVERWIPRAMVRKDLWGWCDILALDPMADGDVHIVAVQTTTKPNMKARINKIEDSDTISLVRKANIEVYVHGWFKRKGKWEVAITDLS